LGQDEEGGSCIYHKVTQSGIIQKYMGDVAMPLKMRGFGHIVYGRGVRFEE
jgi:hypothetical protein